MEIKGLPRRARQAQEGATIVGGFEVWGQLANCLERPRRLPEAAVGALRRNLARWIDRALRRNATVCF